MTTVAVFGAGGKLGRHVLRVLAKRGMAVRALCHRTPIAGENVKSIPGSITDGSPGGGPRGAGGADGHHEGGPRRSSM